MIDVRLTPKDDTVKKTLDWCIEKMKKVDFNGQKNLVGNRVSEARKRIGVSQAELAARMQVRGVTIDQQSISKIERNMRIVTDYEMICLCEVLKVNSPWLLGI